MVLVEKFERVGCVEFIVLIVGEEKRKGFLL